MPSGLLPRRGQRYLDITTQVIDVAVLYRSNEKPLGNLTGGRPMAKRETVKTDIYRLC